MKIKAREDDFIVEERINIPYKKGGNYKVYLLEKRGYNTVDLLLKISKIFRIPYNNISYAGKKDRYGTTKQYISVEGKIIDEIEEKNFSLKYIGECERKIGPDLLEGNDFKVIIRDLEKKDEIIKEIEEVKRYGFVNYFDDQRFGSFSKDGFIAEKIIKKHYNGALKIYLTSMHKGDKKEEKERKRFFLKKWKDWDLCLKNSKTKFEKIAFKILKEKQPNPFLKSINLIPKEELSIFFSAYQSFLWNQVAEKIIKIYGKEFLKYNGLYWDYIFYKNLSSFEYLKDLKIPTISHNIKYPDDLVQNIYEEVLKMRELKKSDFNLKKVKKAYFKSTFRNLIVFPEIKDYSFIKDEIYNKFGLKIEFFLPKGSYGTMLIKRLFSEVIK
jgi:tRNA pseudouridine13 synthase